MTNGWQNEECNRSFKAGADRCLALLMHLTSYMAEDGFIREDRAVRKARNMGLADSVAIDMMKMLGYAPEHGEPINWRRAKP